MARGGTLFFRHSSSVCVRIVHCFRPLSVGAIVSLCVFGVVAERQHLLRGYCELSERHLFFQGSKTYFSLMT
jgi:hypothetical protein